MGTTKFICLHASNFSATQMSPENLDKLLFLVDQTTHTRLFVSNMHASPRVPLVQQPKLRINVLMNRSLSLGELAVSAK